MAGSGLASRSTRPREGRGSSESGEKKLSSLDRFALKKRKISVVMIRSNYFSERFAVRGLRCDLRRVVQLRDGDLRRPHLVQVGLLDRFHKLTNCFA